MSSWPVKLQWDKRTRKESEEKVKRSPYLARKLERLLEDDLHVFEKTSVKLSLHNQSGL